MATKTKLKQAVESQAKTLDPAQREFIFAEFRQWNWNDQRIRNIENMLELDSKSADPMKAAARKALMTERHQLVGENSSMFNHIMKHLQGTGDDTDEFDAFMGGVNEAARG